MHHNQQKMYSFIATYKGFFFFSNEPQRVVYAIVKIEKTIQDCQTQKHSRDVTLYLLKYHARFQHVQLINMFNYQVICMIEPYPYSWWYSGYCTHNFVENWNNNCIILYHNVNLSVQSHVCFIICFFSIFFIAQWVIYFQKSSTWHRLWAKGKFCK